MICFSIISITFRARSFFSFHKIFTEFFFPYCCLSVLQSSGPQTYKDGIVPESIK